MITQADLDNWFTYHALRPGQAEQHARLREAARQFAEAILANTPAGADQTPAIRKVREATFLANAAVACTPVA